MRLPQRHEGHYHRPLTSGNATGAVTAPVARLSLHE
jgi:hypothetical protein